MTYKYSVDSMGAGEGKFGNEYFLVLSSQTALLLISHFYIRQTVPVPLIYLDQEKALDLSKRF